ncbi:Cof-type HAD-IIB family hydrolase [Microbacterium sp. W1N]|uniref:Cof-type HAD-IIB family hydrolase n=1 Tax=Microbacterium festucae TaxID=2977531 RepID=UPI0021BE2D9C|nr:Cof-type HAD-IIB family hydrolase [Microbacterium festucae]MCT9819704.1 Cof-type HAD-IIB family hydrolase [Microbacterium festucae]
MEHVTQASPTPQRIAFIDVDGTILEHGSIIAPSTVTAIRSARANGHLVYLCTGRAAGDIHPAVQEIGFDGAITNGGAFATRGDERVVEHLMPRADVDRMVAYFEAHGIHYFLQTNDAVYASDGIGGFVEEFFEQRRTRHAEDLKALGLDEEDEPLPMIQYRPMAEADLDAVVKSTFISSRSDTLDHAQNELGERFHVIPGSIPLPGGSNGEIMVRGVNKGSAILEVLDLLGKDAADAVGIGDSWNDVEMFQVVGQSFAMAGADPELQAIAGRVTTGVLDDGVRNALVSAGLV